MAADLSNTVFVDDTATTMAVSENSAEQTCNMTDKQNKLLDELLPMLGQVQGRDEQSTFPVLLWGVERRTITASC